MWIIRELVQWCRGETSLTTTARLRWHREHLDRLAIRHTHTLDDLRGAVAIGVEVGVLG